MCAHTAVPCDSGEEGSGRAVPYPTAASRRPTCQRSKCGSASVRHAHGVIAGCTFDSHLDRARHA